MELKLGGTYRTRNGDELKIVRCTGNSSMPWQCDNGETYTADGRYFHDAGEESSFDLIEEISTEPAPFAMDARATMAMHFMAQCWNPTMRHMFPADAHEACLAADALIAELQKGNTE